MQTQTGRIIMVSGGFYDVKTAAGLVVRCRARGVFRKQHLTPLAGDFVTLELLPDGSGYLLALAERRNSLQRPPVANLDLLALVVSTADPPPNLLVLDRLLALAEYADIPAALIFTKPDLADPAPFLAAYKASGYPLFRFCGLTGEGLGELQALFSGRFSVLCGNSGAGKTTLLNALSPTLALPVGETSRRLGRGRHTTRHVELYAAAGGLIADTPGFSSLEIQRENHIPKDQLQFCFPEFAPHLMNCRFTGCSHTGEKGCAVGAALLAGELSASRCQSYSQLYREAEAVHDWELPPQTT